MLSETIELWLGELRDKTGAKKNADIPKTALSEEIEEVSGTIDNEKIFKSGSDRREARLHEENIYTLMEYKEILSDLLGGGNKTANVTVSFVRHDSGYYSVTGTSMDGEGTDIGYMSACEAGEKAAIFVKEAFKESLFALLPKGIEFDEEYTDNDGMTTYYFTAPKETLECLVGQGVYPEADAMELAVELPEGAADGTFASVTVSPSKTEDGMTTDYDWRDIDLPADEVDALILFARKALVQQEKRAEAKNAG